MRPDEAALQPLARAYLERQSWFWQAVETSGPIEFVDFEVLLPEIPGLGRLIAERSGRRFQLLVGWRAPADAASALRGREGALLGPVNVGEAQVLAFDALEDDELALEVLRLVTDGREEAHRVRRVSSLVSHASLVFDERLFMKCYRVLEPGTRTEVEVVFALDGVGFNSLVAPVARWRGHDADLALVREFLPSALEGRLLALTSLRDLLARTNEPGLASAEEIVASAGGDFASEMQRLGRMTASLHLALADAFGEYPADPTLLAEVLEAAGADPSQLDGEVLGRAIRRHGDYHLRRVMRTEFGWVVAGFSDDPIYGVPQRSSSLPARVGLPLEDLADMNFSLGLVAKEALANRRHDDPAKAASLVTAWERRNRIAFLSGYREVEGAQALLPEDEWLTEQLLGAYGRERERRYEATSSAEG